MVAEKSDCGSGAENKYLPTFLVELPAFPLASHTNCSPKALHEKFVAAYRDAIHAASLSPRVMMSTSIPNWIQETESKHDPDVESISTFTEDIVKTPATTTEFSFPSFAPSNVDAMCSPKAPKHPGYASAVPQPGKTYKIHLRDKNQLITLEEGHLQLQPINSGKPGGGWDWTCVERVGWLQD